MSQQSVVDGVDAIKKIKKICIVPGCQNTSTKTPKKLFLTVPKNEKKFRLWQTAIGRPSDLSIKKTRFCCEDHFDLPNDVENYMYFLTMRPRVCKLKDHVVPHIFNDVDLAADIKTEEIKIDEIKIEDVYNNDEYVDTAEYVAFSSNSENTAEYHPSAILENENDKATQTDIETESKDVSVQCNILSSKTLKIKRSISSDSEDILIRDFKKSKSDDNVNSPTSSSSSSNFAASLQPTQ